MGASTRPPSSTRLRPRTPPPPRGRSVDVAADTATRLAKRDLRPGRGSRDRAVDVWWTSRRPAVAEMATELARLQALLQSPLPDSNRRPPPYHALETATARNQRQRFWLVSAVSAPIPFATSCHRLQPRGSIKAPSFVAYRGNRARAGTGSIPSCRPLSLERLSTVTAPCGNRREPVRMSCPHRGARKAASARQGALDSRGPSLRTGPTERGVAP
jgi:hypothetical protein